MKKKINFFHFVRNFEKMDFFFHFFHKIPNFRWNWEKIDQKCQKWLHFPFLVFWKKYDRNFCMKFLGEKFPILKKMKFFIFAKIENFPPKNFMQKFLSTFFQKTKNGKFHHLWHFWFIFCQFYRKLIKFWIFFEKMKKIQNLKKNGKNGIFVFFLFFS